MILTDWAGLPKHLLDLILKKLVSSKDYIHFGVACSSWHDVTKDNQGTHINLSHQVPMLITPNEEENTWNVYDPTTDTVRGPKLVVPYGKRFSGSSKGWLVTVEEDFSVTLHKPFSMANEVATIRLPCLFPPSAEDDLDLGTIEPYIENCYDHISKATITADPLANPNDCVVVVIYGEIREVAFIRPAKDTTWTKVDLKEKYVFDIVFHNNEFFALSFNSGRLESFDISDPRNVKVKLVVDGDDIFYLVKPYLVKSHSGELLRIDMDFRWEDNNNTCVTKHIKIFKLDLNESKSSWIEIKTLGDEALFLGDNSSISVLASDFAGFEPNWIYFPLDIDLFGDGGTSWLAAYDIEDERYLYLAISSSSKARLLKQPPIWIVPTLNIG